ncbi:MAG: hypothetical protein USCGTAYLOR_01012 [Chromatiales bacterium USCg_Taylor]|nr:MAG: hypothetical protein USCGTAYLOR_01012 [Chromatiales bacterium USCg_Taylor]
MLAPNTESATPSAASGRTRRFGYLTRVLAAIIAVAGAAWWF